MCCQVASRSTSGCARELIEDLRAKAVIADKGYDADTFVQAIRATGAKAVLPPRSHRITKRRHSRPLYRTRNVVEPFFNRIKHFHRVSTRYDKLADRSPVFASLACARTTRSACAPCTRYRTA